MADNLWSTIDTNHFPRNLTRSIKFRLIPFFFVAFFATWLFVFSVAWGALVLVAASPLLLLCC